MLTKAGLLDWAACSASHVKTESWACDNLKFSSRKKILQVQKIVSIAGNFKLKRRHIGWKLDHFFVSKMKQK